LSSFGFAAPVGAVVGSVAGGEAGAWLGSLFDGTGGADHGGPATTTTSTTATGKKGSSKPTFVTPAKGNITSKFGPRTPPKKGASNNHKGVDIANSQGTAIVAAADGKVVFTGWNGNYGKHVRIKHQGGDYVTTYSHLNTISVKGKQQVLAGNKIATMGTTGNSTGPHLHFEVLKNGAFIDPATVVPGLSGSTAKSTVTNTQKEAPKTAGDKETTAEGAENEGASSGTSNGSSELANALGFAATNFSQLGGVPSNVAPLVANAGAQTTSKNATDNTGRGGPNAVGMGMTGGEPSLVAGGGGGSRGGVVINLNIKQASDSEARRFAKIVKDILDDDNNISKIGRG
jgi:murein DD-endopeptidase MepM/ murein hydrolase activator NlpD